MHPWSSPASWTGSPRLCANPSVSSCTTQRRLPRELWRAGLEPADDTEIAAYLIDPNRSGYLLDDLAAEYGIEAQPDPPAEPETEALVRRAAATLGARRPPA